jgi:hypothetical protein
VGGWVGDWGLTGAALDAQCACNDAGFVETGVYIQDFGTWDRDALLCLGIAFFLFFAEAQLLMFFPASQSLFFSLISCNIHIIRWSASCNIYFFHSLVGIM